MKCPIQLLSTLEVWTLTYIELLNEGCLLHNSCYMQRDFLAGTLKKLHSLAWCTFRRDAGSESLIASYWARFPIINETSNCTFLSFHQSIEISRNVTSIWNIPLFLSRTGNSWLLNFLSYSNCKKNWPLVFLAFSLNGKKIISVLIANFFISKPNKFLLNNSKDNIRTYFAIS